MIKDFAFIYFVLAAAITLVAVTVSSCCLMFRCMKDDHSVITSTRTHIEEIESPHSISYHKRAVSVAIHDVTHTVPAYFDISVTFKDGTTARNDWMLEQDVARIYQTSSLPLPEHTDTRERRTRDMRVHVPFVAIMRDVHGIRDITINMELTSNLCFFDISVTYDTDATFRCTRIPLVKLRRLYNVTGIPMLEVEDEILTGSRKWCDSSWQERILNFF